MQADLALPKGPNQVGNASPREGHSSKLRRLLNDRDAAQLLGVCGRTFGELLSKGWLPEPIQLGPRLRRWDADELLEAVRSRAPRGNKGTEPEQLRRARIERMKSGNGATAKAA